MQSKKKRFSVVICIMVLSLMMTFQPVFANEITKENIVTVINGNEKTVTVDEDSTIILDKDLEIIELSEQNENSSPNTRYFKIQRKNHTFATIVWILILAILLITLSFDICNKKNSQETRKSTKKRTQKKK